MKLYFIPFLLVLFFSSAINAQNQESKPRKIKIVPNIGIRWRSIPYDWEELKRIFKPVRYPTQSNWSFRQPGYRVEENTKGYSLSPAVTFHFNQRHAIEYIAHLRYDVTHTVNDWKNWRSIGNKKIEIKSFLHDHDIQFVKTFKKQKNRIGLGVGIVNTFKKITVYYPRSKEHTNLQYVSYNGFYQRKIYKNINAEIKISYTPRGFPNHPLLKVVECLLLL